jgi:ABC-2 type transport system permease protein
MSAAGQAVRQLRFTNKAFWRNPASAFFTFAFPLMFLVIFTSLLGGGQIQLPDVPRFELDLTTYYVGAMATFGVISACFTNIAIQTSFSRDQGLLKRLRGTPLPAGAYMSARVVHATAVGALLVVITLIFGLLVYDAPLPTGAPLLEFIVTFLVGSLTFAALALALTAVIPNADAAPPIVNATILPLLFLSGIFIPLDKDAPAWISTVANLFPVKHFADAMRSSYLGNVTARTPLGTFHPFSFDWTDVLIVAGWGVVGLVLAARFFSWEPRR